MEIKDINSENWHTAEPVLSDVPIEPPVVVDPPDDPPDDTTDDTTDEPVLPKTLPPVLVPPVFIIRDEKSESISSGGGEMFSGGKTQDDGGKVFPDDANTNTDSKEGYEMFGYYYTKEHLAGIIGGALIGGIVGYKAGNVNIGVVSGLVIGMVGALLLKKPEKK